MQDRAGAAADAPARLIYWTILLLTCGDALVSGRKYERIAAGVFLVATNATVIDHLLLHIRYQSIDVGEAFVDFAVLISVVAIALSERAPSGTTLD